MVIVSATMLGTSLLVSAFAIPLFKKHMPTLKFALLAAQQISMIGFLVALILLCSLFNEIKAFYIINQALNTGTTKFDVITANDTISFFHNFFYHYHYFLAMMQTLDINVMICKPFDYAKFSKLRKTLKYLSLGALVCMIGGLDDLLPIIVSFVWVKESLSTPSASCPLRFTLHCNS